MKRVTGGHVPRNVAKRIIRRAAPIDEPIVVTIRRGKHRKQRTVVPDPLGAFDAAPPRSLGRKSLYEEE